MSRPRGSGQGARREPCPFFCRFERSRIGGNAMSKYETADQPRVGLLPSGARDAISDVPGVSVGHATHAEGACQTGVTVVRPHGGDLFLDKVPAAASVINGFGKSVGLVQVEELGVLETPIALTNTFGVGTVANAQIRQAVAANPRIGREWGTVNPLVFECNDGYLNDIQAMAVSEADYLQACATAAPDFAQGAVGAGRGMSSFSFKGGIGSASRLADCGAGRCYTVGALVLSNFGRLPLLTVAGHAVGRRLAAAAEAGPEKGSIILLVATDAPLDARQLRRLSLRAAAGLARTGSVFGHGSGDIALAFSTAYTVPHEPQRAMPALPMLHEALIDPLFEAAAEACEQAIVAALWRAETVHGRDGHVRRALPQAIPDWRQWLTRPHEQGA
ncbi:DmpA family aminopeptidase [Bordetella trematum]|uniref:DmpA family aminopeptidase n=1 Tax=Bordetella trematum TaxID=123899 RepID=UPI0035E4141E